MQIRAPWHFKKGYSNVLRQTLKPTVLILLALVAAGCGLFGESREKKLAKIAVWEDQGWTADGQLTKLMFDRDAVVRRRASLAIARVNDTLVVDSVRLALLEDSDPQVRINAAFAIGVWTWHRGIPALLEALGREKDPEALVGIMQACARSYTRDDFPKFFPFLHHQDPRVRAQAILTFDMLNKPDLADSILPLLADKSPDVRWAAVFALSHAHSDRVVGALLSRCNDTSAAIRKMACFGVASSPLPELKDTILHWLSDPNPDVRGYVADALASNTDTLFILKVLPLLDTERDPGVLQRLVNAVGEHWRMQAQPYLQRLLHHDDPGVRAAASSALCRRLDFAFADLVAPVVHDPSPLVKHSLLETIDQLRQYAPQDTAKLFPLIRMLMADSIARIRARAVQSYVGFGAPDAGVYLNRLYNDRDPYAVQLSINIIGGFNLSQYQDSLYNLYFKYKDQWRPEIKWAIIASSANMSPSVEPTPVRRELFNMGMLDPNRLVRWYTIAVWEKFREDHRRELGVYKTDLTPENAGQLLHPYAQNPTVRIQTTRGPVVLELRADLAPRAVRRFIQMAKEGVYDNCPVNDLQAGALVQTGDRRGDGWGLPDETIRDEFSPERVVAGSVIWVINSRDSGHGIFAIALDRLPYLDWRYATFARVTDGLQTARALTYMDSLRTVEILSPGAL